MRKLLSSRDKDIIIKLGRLFGWTEVTCRWYFKGLSAETAVTSDLCVRTGKANGYLISVTPTNTFLIDV